MALSHVPLVRRFNSSWVWSVREPSPLCSRNVPSRNPHTKTDAGANPAGSRENSPQCGASGVPVSAALKTANWMVATAKAASRQMDT